MSNEPHKNDLEIVPNEYADKEYEVNVSIPEFNCVCPRTGLPDFATIKINYIPNKHIVELKSLKYYLLSYVGVGIVQEHAANKILEDLVKICQPKQMKIFLNYKVRGGLHTTVSLSYPTN